MGVSNESSSLETVRSGWGADGPNTARFPSLGLRGLYCPMGEAKEFGRSGDNQTMGDRIPA